eukprot:CAMPEP_0202691028 /NCGR_PEP_ID=MMETSP1385-20130828/5858_1 /ASSEMBLY_ACC=CAM_ASM_000861 /TAXON_ID=933848 /ORGANISM="Elphidium margaritaceum" /LENGTH=451 /DNA_ID=CAMNT_0049346369 /DNA_START=37 /DNA_END=1392 /DNA_ORIENTATION=-
MSLNLQTDDTKILYLPLKNETLPKLQPHTTLTQPEHGKLKDIASDTFDVCTGITKHAYSAVVLAEILRTLKPGGVVMIQIGKEADLKSLLTDAGFNGIECNTRDQVTHWTARKPKTKVVHLNPEVESKQVSTSYRTSPTSYGRFFVTYPGIDIDALALHGSTLLLPTVGVGNIAQIAMDILLTTLAASSSSSSSTSQLVKIGYINDRNLVSGVGNDGIKARPKKKKQSTIKMGALNAAMEVYWHADARLCLVQQRSAVRIGGRGEFVRNLMQFIERNQFAQIVVMTSDYITKRSDAQTQQNTKLVYFHSNAFDADLCTALQQGNVVPNLATKNAHHPPRRFLSLLAEDEPMMDDVKKDEDEGFTVIGHGITQKLYDECVQRKQSVIVLCEFTEDGDNTLESEGYLDHVMKLVTGLSDGNDDEKKWKDAIKKWKHPYSLSFANGGALPSCIY